MTALDDYIKSQQSVAHSKLDQYIFAQQQSNKEAAAREADRLQEELTNRQFLQDQLYEATAVPSTEVNDPVLQFNLARLDKMQDKINYLDTRWPGKPKDSTILGLVTKEGEPFVGYEKDGSFFAVNKPGASWMDIPAAAGELGAEFIGTVAGSVSPTMKGKIAMRVLTEGIASATGKTVDEVIDTLTLGQTETLSDIAGDISSDAVWNIVGGRLGDLGARIGNMLKGRGFKLGIDATSAEKEAQADAVRAAINMEEQTGVHVPAPAIGGEVVTRAENIAEVTGQSSVAKQRRIAVVKALRAFDIDTQNIVDTVKDTKLLDLINLARGKATSKAMSAVGTNLGFKMKATSKEAGGKAIKSIWDEGGFAERSRSTAKNLYDNYFDLAGTEGVTYDLTNVIKAAKETGTKYRLSAGTESYKVIAGLDASRAFNTVTKARSEVFGANLSPELESLVKKLQQVDAIQKNNPAEVTRALKQIRSSLIDLSEKTPLAPNKTVSQGEATNLLRAVDDAISHPSGAPDEMVAAFRKASSFWKKRAEILDSFTVADAKGVGSGEQIYNGMKGRIGLETAKTLKTVLAPKRFEEFQSAMIWDMLRNPSKIKSMLADLGDAGRELLPRKTRQYLELFQGEIDNIDTGILSYALTNQAVGSAQVGAIIGKAAPEELAKLIKSGAIKEKDVPVLIFHDFMEKTLKDNVIVRDGVEQIKPEAFTAGVKKLKDSHLWKYLTKGQKAILSDFQRYTSFMKGADAGTSIVGSQIVVGQLTPFTDPKKAVKMRTKSWQIGLIAKATTNDAITKLYAGLNASPKSLQVLRGTILSIMNAINQIGDEVRTDNMGINYDEQPSK